MCACETGNYLSLEEKIDALRSFLMECKQGDSRYRLSFILLALITLLFFQKMK